MEGNSFMDTHSIVGNYHACSPNIDVKHISNIQSKYGCQNKHLTWTTNIQFKHGQQTYSSNMNIKHTVQTWI